MSAKQEMEQGERKLENMRKKENTMTEKEQRKRGWQTLRWVLKEVHSLDRSFTPLMLLHTLVKLGTIYAPILLIAPVLDGLISKNWDKAWLWGLIMVVTTIMVNLLENYLMKVGRISGEKVYGLFATKMYHKPMTLDYPSSQDSEKKRAFQRAFQSMQYEGNLSAFFVSLFAVLGDVLSLLTSISLTVVMLLARPVQGGWLRTLAQPWLALPLAFISIFLVSTLARKSNNELARKERKLHEEHIKVEADIMYLNQQVIFSTKDYALYQLNDMIPMIRTWLGELLDKTSVFFAAWMNVGIRQTINGDVSALVFLLVAWLLAGAKVLTGAVPVAMLVTYANSLIQVSKSWLSINENIMTVVRRIPYYRDIQDYVSLENKFETGSIPVEKRNDNEVLLEMENVSFKYPGSDRWALRNVNVSLDMKKRHAVVGLNGAGKTTFILLLCRLYEPTEGRILLNGVDIRKYDYKEYLRLFSVVFQDFQLFAFPLAENVASAEEFDEARVRKCLTMAGFGERLAELEAEGEGLETDVVSVHGQVKHFSGGEQQKIAIARALYNQGSVMILDEPTAALDPISEADIYAHLNDLIQDKTTVFISHRMSSCRFCSDILVFNEGEVVERGTHDELLGLQGLYRSMWDAQAKYYLEQGHTSLVA